MKKTQNQMLIIFGASGDLTARKLVPALYNLYKGNHLPENFVVLGASRSSMSDEEFRLKIIQESEFLKDKIRKEEIDYITTFAEKIFYEDLGDNYDSNYGGLARRIRQLNDEKGCDENFIFYLSTPPSLYEIIAKNLFEAGLTTEENGWKRIIVEKPFGYSLETARELNEGLHKYFNEPQVYRIDHYLGKETVQNLLVTRFSNSIFEPTWNRRYIHHVEITNAETVGVEKRGGYYDRSGALRDMFQSHLLQVVSLIVMEPPINSSAEEIRDEKVKALKSLRIMKTDEELATHTMKGQYVASTIDGKKVKGYRQEEGVDPDSKTETFAAVKFFVDNWRWKDVPFYVRTAKYMPTKVTEVVIHFKSPAHEVFKSQDVYKKDNKLIIRVQPDEGILMKFGVKVPGLGFQVEQANMEFYYSDLDSAEIMDAYERLLLDAMQGDATLYARADEVEAAWKFVDPILKYWENEDVPTYGYAAGTWGPRNSDDMIEGHFGWRNPGNRLTDETGFCIL
ncbi:glucose-6-phosphate dehydrogenase [Algoriphagus sp. AGSA1]|uniref:glucose-6-phosphate dehydrogenase n=1 Tax=Algoriphagus sp. AGSA1 TaxID=2907213 RepID=UPI001F339A0B|nr:glucose-6-phosphate dehydrogenase [Algoriphagus sp. AGSA1]MCE7055892.1 glucose-6-phosphate dehydrogenase [Algoriphagus sp. AGSA1]